MRKVKCPLKFCLPGHPHWLWLPCLISSTGRAVMVCWEKTRHAWVRQKHWILANSTGCYVFKINTQTLQHFHNFVYCVDGPKTVCTKFKHTDIARSVTPTIHRESCLFPFHSMTLELWWKSFVLMRSVKETFCWNSWKILKYFLNKILKKHSTVFSY